MTFTNSPTTAVAELEREYMPLFVNEVHNGVQVSHDVISEHTSPARALNNLHDHLVDTATIEYAVKVIEWWFTGRDNELRMPNGQDVDVWEWTGDGTL